MNIKKYIFELIQPTDRSNIGSLIFDIFIMTLITFSVLSVFIATFPISSEFSDFLNNVENFSLIVFSAEYLLRVWTADLLYPGKGKIRSRLAYITSTMAVIDLIAILPFFLPMFLPFNLLSLRAFKLLRILRIFKLSRYLDALSAIIKVFRKKLHEMVASMIVVFILLIIVSLLIYYVEHDAQPDKFANAFSGLWWAVATLTTVGYGDIYPITVPGRILGAIIAIMGIGMVAIPAGILSSGFVEIIEQPEPQKNDQKEEKKTYCPHCGKKL